MRAASGGGSQRNKSTYVDFYGVGLAPRMRRTFACLGRVRVTTSITKRREYRRFVIKKSCK
jgi:hypothetical protein